MSEQSYIAPDARARNALGMACRTDPYENEAEIGEEAANRKKADAVRASALDVVRNCMDNRDRDDLKRLLLLACDLEKGDRQLSQDVVWIFELAFGNCSSSFAWAAIGGLDLVDDLLTEVGFE